MTEEQKPFVPKTPTDIQKMKLDRLMAHPEKPVIIPEGPREKKGLHVPEFVRNVMGSSAGAGSGEFHVYRHLRRKEYTRQKLIDEKSEKDKLDEEYLKKIEDNQSIMEEKTAKKRAKRLKRKEKLKQKKSLKDSKNSDVGSSGDKEENKNESEEESSESESSEEEKEELAESSNCGFKPSPEATLKEAKSSDLGSLDAKKDDECSSSNGENSPKQEA